MRKYGWLLASLCAAAALGAAAYAGEKPQDAKWQALPHFFQITEISVADDGTGPQRCPCCDLFNSMQSGCDAPWWLVAAQCLKPLALGCQLTPFLGYLDQDDDTVDPQVIVAQFLQAVTQQNECVPARCQDSSGCAFTVVTGCTANGKCVKEINCTCPVSCTTSCTAVGCDANCKCSGGKNCCCTTSACACKGCGCSKSACCTECQGQKCCEGSCDGDCCPRQQTTPRAAWMQQPLPPGMQWAPVMVHPWPGMMPPWAHMPPPGMHMPMPPMAMPEGMPYPVAIWHGQPPYPRILPPVADEQCEGGPYYEPQSPDAPPAQYYQASRGTRWPTPARPVSWTGTQVKACGGRVCYSTPNFDATCERLSCQGNVVVLEGDVQLVLRSPGQTGRICAQRVEVNADTGTFNVGGAPQNSVHNAPTTNCLPQTGFVPTSYKPDTAPPTPRPVQR